MSKTLKRKTIIYIAVILVVLAGGAVLLSWVIQSVQPYHAEYYVPVSQNTVLVNDGGDYYFIVDGEKSDAALKSYNSFIDRAVPAFVPFMIFMIYCLVVKEILNYYPDPLPMNLSRIKELFRDGTPDDLISLTSAPGGLITVREWAYEYNDNLLSSVSQNTQWKRGSLKADAKPELNQFKGIYAYRLGLEKGCLTGEVQGICSMSGKCIIHTDGVVRGNRCQILVLVVKKEKYVESLKTRYKCPIVVTRDPERTISNWAISPEGLFWMQHNNDLIEKGLKNKFESDIDEIVKNKFKEVP